MALSKGGQNVCPKCGQKLKPTEETTDSQEGIKRSIIITLTPKPRR